MAILCNDCGERNPESAEFCQGCGRLLEWHGTTVADIAAGPAPVPPGRAYKRHAEEVHQLFSSLSDAELAVTPGEQVTLTVTIRNGGTIVEEVMPDLAGLPSGWWSFDPPRLTLLPGTEARTAIRVSPPRRVEATAGSYVIGVAAISGVDRTIRADARATVVVRPFVEVSASLAPENSAGRFGATHNLSVENASNTRITANVAAADKDQRLRIAAAVSELVLDPGASETLRLRVRPTRLRWLGPSQPRRFTANVATEAGPTIDKPGTFTQLAILPRWVLSAAAVLVAGIIAIGVLNHHKHRAKQLTGASATSAVTGHTGRSLKKAATGATATTGATETPTTGATATPTTGATATATTGATATATTGATARGGGTASTSVPAGFEPDAVTFVSRSEGWVVGTLPCAAGSCLAMAHTSNGGGTWQGAPAPTFGAVTTPAQLDEHATISVRFADPMDGWIYALPSPTTDPYRLWSTHDGGTTWRDVTEAAVPSGSQILAMEARNGQVDVVTIPTNSSTLHVESSPVGTDNWTDTDTRVQIGAGPIPSAELVLQDSTGWLIENDRTVIGGGLLVPPAHWASWPDAPCLSANGVAFVAASSTKNMVAVCHEGDWGPAGNLPAGATIPSWWMLSSSDGGGSFQPVGQLPTTFSPQEVATPSPATVVVDGALNPGNGSVSALSASFDGGQTWQTVYQSPQTARWADLGFTTLTQGVIVGYSQSGSVLLMTRDGGHNWGPVSF
jgi:hypothetical protein